MKFGFVTCVQLGLSCMEAIYEIGGKLDLVITLNDSQAVNKSGRIFVDEFCEKHNIFVHKSSHINNIDCIQAVKHHNLDWLFIIGWSQIANKQLIQSPKKGVLGIHPTLLPVGRGRASIPWAILKGLDKTGVTLFKLDEGVDTGEILVQKEISLHKLIDAKELYEKVNSAHSAIIKTAFCRLSTDNAKFFAQDNNQATVWPGRRPEDGEINLDGSVYLAEKLVRAVTRPYPGAFFYKGPQKIIVWASRVSNERKLENCIYFKDGVLELLEFELLEQ